MKKTLLVWMLLALLIGPMGFFPFQSDAVIKQVDNQTDEHRIQTVRPTQNPIRILVHGKSIEFDAPPYIKEGRTMVPVRFVSERLGAHVDWDGSEQKVTITMDERRVVLIIGDTRALVDGREIQLDVPAEISKDRTMVPLRFVSEALGTEVEWDGDTRTVFVGPVEITLYFSDRNAEFLIPEKREVMGVDPGNAEKMSEEIFNQLLKGPERADLRRTIHDSGTRNIVIILTGELPTTGTLYLNLTKNFVDRQKQVGLGSAGETMAVYSIVNSLCEQPNVKSIKFLEEGRDPEAIFGHIYTGEPITPKWNLVRP